LYGDTQPHETFEEAATDYIAEIRKVQPAGPYLLGGFSGGGITAYEIAKQLIAQGESVLEVIFLDTPLRENTHFSIADKASMFLQGLRTGGVGFLRRKVRERIEWEKQQYLRRRENEKTEQIDPLKFQSKRIGDAFLRALGRYRVERVPIRAALFRPKLDVRYRLSGGRRVDSDRNYISEDNGWSRYVSELEIFEVPGNHDTMVLEPNVRVLVSLLRRSIRAAEDSAHGNAHGAAPAPALAALS
jgi:thioesterase domain-containing protein